MSDEQQEAPMGPINLEVLKGYFEKADFIVKRMDKLEGMLIFEYNFPDEKREIAMKSALCRNNADVVTQWRWTERPHDRGELAQRERATIPYESDADLRSFFNDVLDDFTRFMEERFGDQISSYKPDTRRRRLDGAVI